MPATMLLVTALAIGVVGSPAAVRADATSHRADAAPTAVTPSTATPPPDAPVDEEAGFDLGAACVDASVVGGAAALGAVCGGALGAGLLFAAFFALVESSRGPDGELAGEGEGPLFLLVFGMAPAVGVGAAGGAVVGAATGVAIVVRRHMSDVE